MRIRAFESADGRQWDAFCQDAISSTFLHTRAFLSYHGDRFEDASLVIEDDRGQWLGILPAAKHLLDKDCVVSHPGITYGGILHTGRLVGEQMIEALGQVWHHYLESGYSRFHYKVVPHVYHRAPAQDDLYALFRLSARRYRCDISCTIDLANRLPVSNRRRRSLKKSHNAGVTLKEGSAYIQSIWQVLRENLARKHDSEPVHSEQEIELLKTRFPDNIRFFAADIDGEIEAGVVVFAAGPVHHAQYIASSQKGNKLNALDAIFEHCILTAKAQDARWFDFGISNEDEGAVLNAGLYSFKAEFGGGGVVHEFYEMERVPG